MRLSDLGEFGLIDRIARLVAATEQAPGPGVGRIVLGIGDDAALLEVPPERQLVATVDTLVEEVHFRRDWTGPEDLGWKSLAVSVSDVAAKGAAPLAAFLSLALPENTDVAWIEAFARGLDACAREYGCALAGGDTVRSPRYLTITLTLLGTVERGRALLRAGAQVGDAVCVTGTLGDSAAGLALLKAGVRADGSVRAVRSDRPRRTPNPEHRTPNTERPTPYPRLLAAHLRPHPPLAAARLLAATSWVTAMMDLSDGLASDLRHLTARSGVGVRIWPTALPISEAARATAREMSVDAADWALHGGEDYELLFTLPPPAVKPARARLLRCDTALVVIGEVVREGLWLAEPGGEACALEPAGFAHFNSP